MTEPKLTDKVAERILKAAMIDEDIQAKSYILLRQGEVNYTLASTKPGQMCSNCRWFIPSNFDQSSGCRIVESWYDSPILAPGGCDRWESRELKAPDQEPLEVVIVEDETRAFLTPKPIAAPILNKLRGMQTPDMMFGRAADGMRLAFFVTSNGYQDRELQHVAQAALTDYVERSYDDEGEWQGDNRLLLWHQKMLDVGDIVWADIRHGFLIEIAKERDTPVASWLWDWWEQNPDRLNAASHGFKVVEMVENVYRQIQKFETSVLPRAAAANVLTLAEVVNMSKTRDQLVNEIFATEQAAEWLNAGTNGLRKLGEHLTAQNVEAKSKDASVETVLETDKSDSNENLVVFNKMLDFTGDLVEAQGALQESFDALESDSATRQKALDEDRATLKKYEDRLEKLEGMMAQAPRASKAARTKLNDDETIDGKTAAEIQEALTREDEADPIGHMLGGLVTPTED